MTAYGMHVVISAIKYLDGAPNGCEGTNTERERREAIYVLMGKLPKTTQAKVWEDRRAFWEPDDWRKYVGYTMKSDGSVTLTTVVGKGH